MNFEILKKDKYISVEYKYISAEYNSSNLKIIDDQLFENYLQKFVLYLNFSTLVFVGLNGYSCLFMLNWQW